MVALAIAASANAYAIVFPDRFCIDNVKRACSNFADLFFHVNPTQKECRQEKRQR